ncbi:MAG: hypothetical protein U9N62_12315, partial [Thermotogota bacterium]|nr:hypothetical protein [Thermotogota bacterium]
MKKWIVLSLVAVLLMTGVAFAETKVDTDKEERAEQVEMDRDEALRITAEILGMTVEDLGLLPEKMEKKEKEDTEKVTAEKEKSKMKESVESSREEIDNAFRITAQAMGISLDDLRMIAEKTEQKEMKKEDEWTVKAFEITAKSMGMSV